MTPPRLRVQSFAMSLDGFGAGEPLLQGLDLPALGYEVARHVPGERALHVFIRKRAAA